MSLQISWGGWGRLISVGSVSWTSKLAKPRSSHGENRDVVYMLFWLLVKLLSSISHWPKHIIGLNTKPRGRGNIFYLFSGRGCMVKRMWIFKLIKSKSTCKLPASLMQVYFISHLCRSVGLWHSVYGHSLSGKSIKCTRK